MCRIGFHRAVEGIDSHLSSVCMYNTINNLTSPGIDNFQQYEDNQLCKFDAITYGDTMSEMKFYLCHSKQSIIQNNQCQKLKKDNRPYSALRVLQYMYTASHITVKIGSGWRLKSKKFTSLVLQTGATPIISLISESNNFIGQKNLLFALPFDQQFDLQNKCFAKKKYLKLTVCSLNSSIQASRTSAHQLSHILLRIKFKSVNDTQKWASLIQLACIRAQWLTEYKNAKCLSRISDGRPRVTQSTSSNTQKKFITKIFYDVQMSKSSKCHELEILQQLAIAASSYPLLLYITKYYLVETLHDTHLIMPKSQGSKNLLQYLRTHDGKCLQEKEAAQICSKILKLVKAVHDANIIHCDIKLENIIITKSNNIQLIDFEGAYNTRNYQHSYSNLSSKTNSFEVMIGTPGYIAPERIKECNAIPTRATDIYSVGVILYQMLVGSNPFSSEPEMRKQVLKLDETLVLPLPSMKGILNKKGISSHAQELLFRMLEASPLTRITTEEALQQSWIHQ